MAVLKIMHFDLQTSSFLIYLRSPELDVASANFKLQVEDFPQK